MALTFLLANIEFNVNQMMFDINSGKITFVRCRVKVNEKPVHQFIQVENKANP